MGQSHGRQHMSGVQDYSVVESMGFLNCTDGCLVPLGGGGQLRRGRPAGRGPKDLAIQPSTRSATFFAQEGKRLFCRREGKGSLTLRSHETFAGAGCFGGPATLLPAVCTVIPYDRWGLSLLRVSGQLRNS